MDSRRLLTLRIIHLALLMGCVTFGVIALVMRQERQGGFQPEQPMLSYIGIALGISTGLAYFFVPTMILKGWLRRLARGESPFPAEAQAPPGGDASESQYWGLLVNHFIIGAALLEGTVFYQLLAYLQEGQPWTLGLAAFFWLLLLVKFPTETGKRRWIETQRDQVALMRNSGM